MIRNAGTFEDTIFKMDFVIFEDVFSRFSRLKPENEDFKGN